MEVRRPSKIDLLISMWDNRINLTKVKRIGKMTLYEGPLSKIFGGQWSGLEFTPPVTIYPTSVSPLTSEAVCATSLKAIVQEYVYTTPA